MSTTSSGRKAEGLVGDYFAEMGCEVLARNMQNAGGEIDLIVALGDLVIFAEVKLRKNARFARGLEYVNRAKRKRYINAAMIWLAENRPEAQARFDVAELYGDIYRPETITINHIENAFSGDLDV